MDVCYSSLVNYSSLTAPAFNVELIFNMYVQGQSVIRQSLTGGTTNLNNYPRSPREHMVPADALHRHFESTTIVAQGPGSDLHAQNVLRYKGGCFTAEKSTPFSCFRDEPLMASHMGD